VPGDDLVPCGSGKIVDQRTLPIRETNTLNRARILSALKVQQIICSGIDDFSVRMLNGMGIQVFPWVSGNAHQALKGFLAGMDNGGTGRAIIRNEKPSAPPQGWKVP